MNLLIATGLYPPDIGGPATYSKILKDELPKHNINVEILSFGEVRHLPKIIRHFIYFLKCLNRGRKADIIFALDPVSVGLPSVLVAKILRKKFILKIVGDYAWEQYQNKISNFQFGTSSLQAKAISNFIYLDKFQVKKFDFLTEVRRKIEQWVAKKTDVIITPSEYLKNIISKGWNIPEKKVKVIYNCAEKGENNMDKSKENKNYIFSVGRLVPWKGFDILISAIKELSLEIKLIIAGNGPEMEKLKKQTKELNLENRVKFTGQISRAEIKRYFSQAKIFVLNTGYEGLSHVILEAMEAGVPVITTDIGGNPELIEDGYNGFLIKYNDKEKLKEAIDKLWGNNELREKFIVNSFEKLKKFSMENMIEETKNILCSI